MVGIVEVGVEHGIDDRRHDARLVEARLVQVRNVLVRLVGVREALRLLVLLRHEILRRRLKALVALQVVEQARRRWAGNARVRILLIKLLLLLMAQRIIRARRTLQTRE